MTDAKALNSRPERSEIFAAVLSSDVERLRASIVKGADPNCLDHLGVTPLYYAITRGDIKSVEALLDAGSNIEMPPDRDDPSLTPLRFAEEFWGLTEIGALLRVRGAKEWESPVVPPPVQKSWIHRIFRQG